MIKHHDSHFVLRNPRQWSFGLGIAYNIALTTIDFVRYSRWWMVSFIVLFRSTNGFVVLPQVKAVSERIGRLLKQQSLRVSYKPQITISSLFPQPKQQDERFFKSCVTSSSFSTDEGLRVSRNMHLAKIYKSVTKNNTFIDFHLLTTVTQFLCYCGIIWWSKSPSHLCSMPDILWCQSTGGPSRGCLRLWSRSSKQCSNNAVDNQTFLKTHHVQLQKPNSDQSGVYGNWKRVPCHALP